MKAIAEHIKKLLYSFYGRFIRLRGTPEQIAWGVALGFFVAMTPTMGVQTYIAIPLAALFSASKIAAAMSVWLTNPITAPFIYGFNYMVGAMILGYPLKAAIFSNPSRETFFNAGKQIFIALTVGGTLTGILVGVAGYFTVVGVIRAVREKAHRLRKKKMGLSKSKP